MFTNECYDLNDLINYFEAQAEFEAVSKQEYEEEDLLSPMEAMYDCLVDTDKIYGKSFGEVLAIIEIHTDNYMADCEDGYKSILVGDLCSPLGFIEINFNLNNICDYFQFHI